MAHPPLHSSLHHWSLARIFSLAGGVLLISLALASCNKTPPVIGKWTGVVAAGPMSIPITLDITQTKGQLQGTVSTSQSSGSMEVTDLAYEADTLKFKVPIAKMEGSFSGQLKDDKKTIEGNWKQGQFTLPLTFTKTAEAK